MKRVAGTLTLLLALSIAAAKPALQRSAPEIPDLRISVGNLLVGRLNPLGLEDQLRIGPQQLLYRSAHPALRDNFVFFGFTPKLNPAFLKAGPSLEIQPVSVFNLKFGFEMMRFFGSFGFLQSFVSPLDDYSDSTLDKGKTAGKNYAPLGVHLTIEPTLQLKLGPIALRNRFSLEYWNMPLRAGDHVWYEATLDTLVPSDGWVLTNDLDLLYRSKYRFVLGARYSVVHPLYRDGDYRLAEKRVNDNGHQRVGPLLAYTFFDKGFASFNKPTLVLIVNWYFDHRWRTGADVSAGIPYLVLGFAFVSDLIPRS